MEGIVFLFNSHNSHLFSSMGISQVTLNKKSTVENNSFLNYKHCYHLIDQTKVLRLPNLNRALPSLHEGSLENMRTVPLSGILKNQTVYLLPTSFCAKGCRFSSKKNFVQNKPTTS